MDKEKVFQIIEHHLQLFPDSCDELATAVEAAVVALQKKKLAAVENRFIVPLIQKDIPTATIGAKHNAAMTLKVLTEEKEGVNVGMAHLQDLHPMTKSGHFKTLHKHGFIEKRARGSYRLSKKGWTLLAVAYKHSMDAKLPKPDPDAHGMDWIG